MPGPAPPRPAADRPASRPPYGQSRPSERTAAPVRSRLGLNGVGLNGTDTAARTPAAVHDILRQPLGEILPRLAGVLRDLVPHGAAAELATHCAHSPVKTTGDTALTPGVTAAAPGPRLASVPAGEPWQGEVALGGGATPGPRRGERRDAARGAARPRTGGRAGRGGGSRPGPQRRTGAVGRGHEPLRPAGHRNRAGAARTVAGRRRGARPGRRPAVRGAREHPVGAARPPARSRAGRRRGARDRHRPGRDRPRRPAHGTRTRPGLRGGARRPGLSPGSPTPGGPCCGTVRSAPNWARPPRTGRCPTRSRTWRARWCGPSS